MKNPVTDGVRRGAAVFGFFAALVDRIKSNRRRKKRLKELGLPEEGEMSETQLSFVRGVVKVLAGALVTKGVIDVGEAGALQVVLETAFAAGLGAWAFWQSHKKHA